MQDPRAQIETLREKIQEGERDVDDEVDREKLIAFSDQLDLLSSEYSDHRHLKLLRHCTRMAEHVGGLADALEDRDAAEAIVRWINREYDNEETNRDYRSAIRVFGKRVSRSDEPPESIAWVPTGTSNSYDPMPSESDMLRWDDEVLPMIEDGARNPRDEACIAVQFEAGLRGGELHDLTVGDVFDGEHAMGVHVDGKTGERSVHLILSVPYLQRWLSDHPAPEDGDAPLWSKLNEAERQQYPPFLNNFKLPAERVGVDKPVTPTNFRKSNTRWLIVSQGLDQTDIEDRQGRSRGSKHTGRYIARFGKKSSERRYAASHGKDVDADESEDRAPVTCPRCGEMTPRERGYCLHCSASLDLEAQELVDEITAALDEKAVESDDPDARRDALDLRRGVQQRPGEIGRERLHDLASRFSSESD